MNFRVTSNTFFSQAIASSQARTADIANLQLQLSTGLRLQKPSDSPAEMRDVLIEKSREGRMESILLNINDARSRLNVSNTRLLDVNDALVSARTILLEANQPVDADTRESLAKQVDSLLSRVLDSANGEDRGDYVFGGTNTSSRPFVLDGNIDSATAGSIRYVGSLERARVLVGTEVSIDTYFSGAEVFFSRQRGETVFVGKTGAASGSGVDSERGIATLEVRTSAVTFAAGSGISSGTSVTDSTIVGPLGAHQLQVEDTSGTGSAGTVSLNGGTVVNFVATDTNLQVTGPHGELIYVDVSSITAGFSGTVDVAATGTLSTDAGQSSVNIDYSSNQQIVNSQTGEVTYVDSSQIRSAGDESLEFEGTDSVFGALISLRDDLRNTRNLDDDALSTAFSRRLTELDRVRENILQMVSEQSVSLENLDALQIRTEDLQLEIRQVISELESADISEVVLRLQQQENLLQFTYASTASILSSTNLLSFLR